jgi:predicted AAA+ superfamily ATPase
MEKLFRRTAIDEIDKYIATDEIIVLHGARQVGKTSILRLLQDQLRARGETTHFIDLEDSRYVRILDKGVDTFLEHLKEEGIASPAPEAKLFVFIDEIQYLADPSSFLKLVADHHRGIKLIVSGSSSFAIKSKFKDSLVGRTVDFEIYPLSFREFLLFNDYPFPEGKVTTQKKIDELRAKFREFVLYGGYPRIVLAAGTERKEKYLQQIIDTYVKKDIRDLANVKDIDKFNKLLEVLASQSGQMVNVREISNTTRITMPTIEKYLFALENTYVLKLVRPFSKNIRSELFKSPKVFFYDSGLMQMLWLKGLQKEVLGQVFETTVFAELVKRYGREAVFYWRTKDKKEIDFIMRKKDTLMPIEAKLNFERFSPGAIRYFNSHYGIDHYRVTALNGIPKDRFQIYPWDPFD